MSHEAERVLGTNSKLAKTHPDLEVVIDVGRGFTDSYYQPLSDMSMGILDGNRFQGSQPADAHRANAVVME